MSTGLLFTNFSTARKKATHPRILKYKNPRERPFFILLVLTVRRTLLPNAQPKKPHHCGQLQRQRTRLGSGLNGLENVEESIHLVVRTRGKVDLLTAAATPVIARDQTPEAINGNRLAIGS